MGYERTHSFQDKNSSTPQPTTQFSSRPFAAPVQMKPKEQQTPEELENEAFDQNKFEAFGLQLKEKSGTITPVEQERLGLLQAKTDDFWAQRREKASRFGFNFSKVAVNPPGEQAAPHLQPMWRQGTSGVPMEGQRSYLNSPQQSSASPIQAKLTIGEPGDKYEQEADAVAAQVVEQINAPATAHSTQGQSVQRQSAEETEEVQAKPEISALQRMDEPNEEEIQGKLIQKEGEANAGGEAATDLESAINSARGGGQPLDVGLQQSMGQAMGADFSGVRVHTDAQADHLNQSIQAKAFTTGQDVFFRQGAYEPGSRGGQELIAHELTHVVQQGEGTVQLKNDDTDCQATNVNPVDTSGILAISNSSAPIQRAELFIQRVWYEKVGEEILKREGKKPGGYRAVKVGGQFLKHEGETVYETQEQRKTHVEKPKTYAELLGLTPEKDSKDEFTVDAKLVRFSQDSIAKTFTAGGSIYDTVESLKSKKISASDLPPIRVFMGMGDRLVTLDNRRLWCCQQAELTVKCKWASAEEVEREAFKFTSGKGKEGSTTIAVRT